MPEGHRAHSPVTGGNLPPKTPPKTAQKTAQKTAPLIRLRLRLRLRRRLSPLTPQGRERKRFVPSAVEQVRAYCAERHNGIDPEAFVDYYAARGWVVGRSPMRDWQAAVRTWERKREAEGQKGEENEDRFYI